MWPPCSPHERRLLEVVLWPPLVCCGTHYHHHTHWINLVNSTAVCKFIYSTCVNVCVWVRAHIFVSLVLRPRSIAGSMQVFLSSEFQTFPPYTPRLLILCITKIFALDTPFWGKGVRYVFLFPYFVFKEKCSCVYKQQKELIFFSHWSQYPILTW